MKTIEELHDLFRDAKKRAALVLQKGVDDKWLTSDQILKCEKEGLRAVARACSGEWVPISMEIKIRMTRDSDLRRKRFLVVKKCGEIDVLGGASFGLSEITHYRTLPPLPEVEG